VNTHTHTHTYKRINTFFMRVCAGVQYKDVKVGSGETPEKGDRVVYDWEGFTIGDNSAF
jgi:FKBP-type peptidyl-prolyl cis-trans isomerase